MEKVRLRHNTKPSMTHIKTKNKTLTKMAMQFYMIYGEYMNITVNVASY